MDAARQDAGQVELPPVAGLVPAVQLAGVSITFRIADTAYTAVEGVTLAVADGEFVAIVGPTGWDPLESTCRHASLSIL